MYVIEEGCGYMYEHDGWREGGREGGRGRCTCTLHVLLMFLIIVTFIHSVTDNNDKILHIILIHVHVDVLLQNVMYMCYTFW